MNLNKQMKWISVDDRLPEPTNYSNNSYSEDVLICVSDDEGSMICTGFYEYYPEDDPEQGWYTVWLYGCERINKSYKVTDWMPLPEHNKEKEVKEDDYN